MVLQHASRDTVLQCLLIKLHEWQAVHRIRRVVTRPKGMEQSKVYRNEVEMSVVERVA